jgi:hypothetical protein
MRTRLQLGGSQFIEAWLNGKSVYRGKPSGEPGPDQAAVGVELREGVNRLLLQVSYQGEKEVVYARLLDPLRRLKYPEGTSNQDPGR